MHAANPRSNGDSPRLSELYDEALPDVYRYLRARCGSVELAEELTSAAFVTAARTLAAENPPLLTTGWLITVARHKLIDHWRREALANRSLKLLEGGRTESGSLAPDPWDVVLDRVRARSVLAALPAHYRSALTLRYLDDLPVSECAALLNRSVRSTESLLVRARSAFRDHYEETGGHHD